MKYILNLFILLSFILPTTSFANQPCVDNGAELHCVNTTLDSLDYKGDVLLEGVTIINKAKIIGDFAATNSNFNHLNIVGDVNLNNSTVNGSTIIVGDVKSTKTRYNGVVKITGDTDFDGSEFQADMVFIGNLVAVESQFNAPVLLSNYKSRFTHSNLQDITVKQQNRDVEQVIYLRDRCIVNNITFPGNKGVVDLAEGSIIKGKLTGGVVTND